MGGILGGLLGVVELIGGAITWLLVGQDAWRDSGWSVFVRSAIGTAFLSLFFGVVIYVVGAAGLLKDTDRPVAHIVLPMLFILLIGVSAVVRGLLRETRK